MIPEEKYAVQKDQDANVITQVPELFTCQCEVKLYDKRTGAVEDWELFYVIPFGSNWKVEAERICMGMGFQTCGFGNYWIRSSFVNAFDMHKDGKAVKEY